MNTQQAIVKRIKELVQEHNKTICDISLSGGITPSTIYDILSGKSKKAQVISIKRFCDGLGITLTEFFDKDYFNGIED